MFAALFEAAPDAIVISNDKGEIILINRQTEKLFGYTRQELIGKQVEVLVPGNLHSKHIGQRAVYMALPNVRAMGAGFDLFAVCKDGTRLPVEISLSPVVTKDGTFISASVRDISVRKKAEEILKQTTRDYQLLVSSVKDYAIFLLDKVGRIATWNSGAEHIKGYTAAEIMGRPMEVFYALEEVELGEPNRNLQKALLQGSFETEGLRVKKDGSTFYANIVFTTLYNEAGEFCGFAKVTKDITEKRKNEEHIQFLASIAENIQDPVITSDNNYIITRWNKAAEKLLEWKSEEVIGKLASEILKVIYADESREQILEDLDVKHFWQGECIYYTKSGIPVNVMLTVSRLKDAGGKIKGNLVLVRDITQRKKAEETLSKINNKLAFENEEKKKREAELLIANSELKKSEAALNRSNVELEGKVKERTEELYRNEKQFRILVENSVDIITMVDENLNTSYRSPSAERITGYSLEERKALLGLDKIHPDDVVTLRNVLVELKKYPQKPFPLSYRITHKDGHYIWLEGTAINLLDDPSIKAIVVNIRDITERKKAEEEINKFNAELEGKVTVRTEQLRKTNEELEAFSYSVSHDLRSPLRAIIGFATILEEDYGVRLDDEGKRIIAVIKNNTLKMGHLIDDLLMFSRMGRQDIVKTVVDTEPMVKEIAGSFTDQKNDEKEIQWIIHPLPKMKADFNTMRQVWINLISNAVKYSGKRTHPKIEIGSFMHDGLLTFFVEDNGVGFDIKYKNKLFKVFQRLHAPADFEGTGIGLAIVEKIITKHGGKVWAEAELDKGASFYFCIPDGDKEIIATNI